ncbi:ABC-type multidrug transport system fused ATPase/permease subunit [Kribbella amoyensis]|uniref:ABC-type multidrug transport system fused ATPase/permease subunit n=1 Tax=Kribbella amoyensis TaxID=996641 RepID=A0A561BZG0_9ACTN|nr:ABC transporter ATP-binding protein [Kribbella amoyensis]TWD84198.1 ABC-type multidrug transport system fused ATPase/permease subunit [Kribbella amoyensis]
MSTQLPVAGPAEVRAAAIRDLKADPRAVAGIVLVSGLAAAAGLIGPWLLGRIIDTIQAGSGNVLSTVDRLAFGALIFTVVQTVLGWWALKIGFRFGERTAARVRERFLRRTLALPPRVADHLPAGDLIARGSTDASLVALTLRSAVPEILVAVVHALFLIVAVLVLDLRLGLCGLVCLLGVGAAVRWYVRRARTVYLAVAASGADLADVVASTAKGARTVELLALEHRRSQITDSAITRARFARLRALWLRTVLFPWSEVALALPVVAVLLVGGALYANDLVSLGVVVTATVYLRQLVGPLDTLMLWIELLQGAGASYARVEGVADIPKTEAGLTPPAKEGGDRIRVDNAHFSYTGAKDVLHGIDLVVQPGERLAVVGTSGAGKSTLARLLAGLDRPHIGSVTIGGTPVAELPPDQLREHVVLITQDHHVFHDTVRDNLLIAKPDATDDELTAALDAVGAGWWADLPHGLDTEIGNETKLDDASAQQLSLARVVLADPHTLILDEATALLDPKTARQTEQSLAAVLRGRTVIAIAHRLQTAHDADRIAVMEAGELVELGTHDELVSAGHVYGRLWRTWHAEPEDDER